MGYTLINEIGNKFGKLTVIERDSSYSQTSAKWICKCDCGNFISVRGNDLRNKKIKSCGCIKYGKHPERVKAINEIGNRYGKLVVIKRLENVIYRYKSGKASANAVWLCQCDCGNFIQATRANLVKGDYLSCNHCTSSEEIGFNGLYARLKNSAKQRGHSWELTKEQVKNLTSQPCYYCGTPPNQIAKSVRKKFNTGNYIYNGLDRVDNSIGYIVNNVVPCCKTCNFAKHSNNVDDFKGWIKSVYDHLFKSQ